ncbi:MAG: UbiA family prenyltransferase [Candidatus Aenigmarchaeota archaeon]|nr:UbiA family prenyltransferase [Candidatus Aenigmarchaeota archaeon]
MRPVNSFMGAIAVLIGAYVLSGSSSLGNLNVYLGIIATFFISGGGMAINDYFDRDIDIINKPHRPIPSGRISVNASIIFSAILFAFGIYISLFINPYCFVLATINSILLVLYSWKLKKVMLIGNIIVSYLVASTFLFGALTVIGNGNLWTIVILSTLAFFANLSREIVKTIEDVKGDRIAGVRTLPMVVGEKTAREIASILLIISIALAPMPYVLDYLNSYYMAVVFLGIILFIFSIIWNQRETPANRVHKLMKIAMLICLIAFLVGAL